MVAGIAFWVVNPVIAVMIMIIAGLTLAIVYVYRSDSDETPQTLAREPDLAPDFLSDVFIDADDKSSISEVTPFLFHPLDETVATEPTAILQQRIEELEKRAKALREELARDPTSISAPKISPSKSLERNGENDEDELSEKAIEQLLEVLDEKLAKRAISEQLYTRLHDKYIARIKKTKMKREASSKKRGTKDFSTGDK